MEILGVILIAADIICIVIEAMIDERWMCFGSDDPHGVASHAHDEYSGLNTDIHAPHRLLGGAHGMEDYSCSGHTAHLVHHHVHILSLTILSYFLLELTAKLIVDPKEFCENRYHILDFIIVGISWLVDLFIARITAKLHEEGEILAVMAVANFVRFWRVVRIIHGCFEEYQIEHKYIADLETQVQALTTHCKENGMPLPESLHNENMDLLRQQSRLESSGFCRCFGNATFGSRSDPRKFDGSRDVDSVSSEDA